MNFSSETCKIDFIISLQYYMVKYDCFHGNKTVFDIILSYSRLTKTVMSLIFWEEVQWLVLPFLDLGLYSQKQRYVKLQIVKVR